MALSIRELKIIDSSLIQLFFELLCEVGRNRLPGGRKSSTKQKVLHENDYDSTATANKSRWTNGVHKEYI